MGTRWEQNELQQRVILQQKRILLPQGRFIRLGRICFHGVEHAPEGGENAAVLQQLEENVLAARVDGDLERVQLAFFPDGFERGEIITLGYSQLLMCLLQRVRNPGEYAHFLIADEGVGGSEGHISDHDHELAKKFLHIFT